MLLNIRHWKIKPVLTMSNDIDISCVTIICRSSSSLIFHVVTLVVILIVFQIVLRSGFLVPSTTVPSDSVFHARWLNKLYDWTLTNYIFILLRSYSQLKVTSIWYISYNGNRSRQNFYATLLRVIRKCDIIGIKKFNNELILFNKYIFILINLYFNFMSCSINCLNYPRFFLYLPPPYLSIYRSFPRYFFTQELFHCVAVIMTVLVVWLRHKCSEILCVDLS